MARPTAEQIERVKAAHLLIYRHQVGSNAFLISIQAHFTKAELGFLFHPSNYSCAPSFFADWLNWYGHNVDSIGYAPAFAPTQAAALMIDNKHNRKNVLSRRRTPMPLACKLAALAYIDERCAIFQVAVDLFHGMEGFGRSMFVRQLRAWSKLRKLVEAISPETQNAPL